MKILLLSLLLLLLLVLLFVLLSLLLSNQKMYQITEIQRIIQKRRQFKSIINFVDNIYLNHQYKLRIKKESAQHDVNLLELKLNFFQEFFFDALKKNNKKKTKI